MKHGLNEYLVNFVARERPIETKIAPVGKSYSALDCQADVVVVFVADLRPSFGVV